MRINPNCIRDGPVRDVKEMSEWPAPDDDVAGERPLSGPGTRLTLQAWRDDQRFALFIPSSVGDAMTSGR